jgi:O-acetyl-ADP-ribose deacetylase (regulator of RNase III)
VPSVDYRTKDPETLGASGPARVRTCMRAALREASVLAKKHVRNEEFVLGAVLLGAGHGGLSQATAAEAMMQTIHEALGPSCLVREVRFALLSEGASQAVREAAAKHSLSLV